MGAAGKHRADGRIVQLPQGSEQTRQQGVRLSHLAVGQGQKGRKGRKLLFKAQHPVAGPEMLFYIGCRCGQIAIYDHHPAIGGVMAVFHARGLDHRIAVNGGGDGLIDDNLTQNGSQSLQGDPAGAQQPGRFVCQIDDGGFHTHPTGAAVHDQRDFAIMVMQHMGRRGGGGLAGDIGRRRGNGSARQADNIPGNIAVRAAHAHGGQAAGGALGNNIPGGQDHGQRPRPKDLGQPVGRFRHIMAESIDLRPIRHMEDQRIIAGTALGLEYFGHSIGIQSIRSQAVYRFRRDRHQLTLPDQRSSRFRGSGLLGGKYKCIHGVSLLG